MARRADRHPKKAKKPAAPPSPAEAFHLHRQAQGQRARTLGMLLVEVEEDYVLALRRAPVVRQACTEAWGPGEGPTVVSARSPILGVPVGQARLHRFPDSEVSFQIDENIRGTDVFIIQPTCSPVDQHLMKLMIMVDAFRRSSAARITAVIPYYGYASRQDRKDKPRVPISAKLVANIVSAAGVTRVLTMDLHKAQIQGFFDIPVDHLFAAPVIIDYLARQRYQRVTIVAPDAGGAERARAYAKRLGAELAVVDKRRSDDGTAEVMNVIGDVVGHTCMPTCCSLATSSSTWLSGRRAGARTVLLRSATIKESAHAHCNVGSLAELRERLETEMAETAGDAASVAGRRAAGVPGSSQG